VRDEQASTMQINTTKNNHNQSSGKVKGDPITNLHQKMKSENKDRVSL